MFLENTHCALSSVFEEDQSSIVSTSVVSTTFTQGSLANPQSASATASATAQESGSPTTAAHKGRDLLTESRRVCLVTGLAVWKGEVCIACACSDCIFPLKLQLCCSGEAVSFTRARN